jgi:hypothetical protein
MYEREAQRDMKRFATEFEDVDWPEARQIKLGNNLLMGINLDSFW